MQAEPTYADIYVRFCEEDFGRKKVPGLEVVCGGKFLISPDVDAALAYIRKLHDDNLKGTPE